jgi:hydrogenase maturation protease
MKIRVLGLGNVLMSDDGFGPYVARIIDAFYELPPQVEIIDAGTPGLDLTPYLLDADAVIFVDAITAPGAAGDVRVYDGAQIVQHPPAPRLGPHEPGLKEALLTVAAAGAGPSYVRLIGVIPEWVATGTTLSPSVESSVAPVISLLLAEFAQFGVTLRPRPIARKADIWWERGDMPTEIRQRLLVQS